MDKVKVNIDQLIDIVRENRKTHRDTFEKALKGYREEAVKHLEQMLEDAKKGRNIRRSLALIEPTDQTKDYDRILRMLELSLDNDIELDEIQFAQFVMDDWAWKQSFQASCSGYLPE